VVIGGADSVSATLASLTTTGQTKLATDGTTEVQIGSGSDNPWMAVGLTVN